MSANLATLGYRFITISLFQVLILFNLQFEGLYHVTPFVYPLFILILPTSMPRWVVLLLGFASGALIDLFYASGGLHAFATVFLAFSRHYLFRIIDPSDGQEEIQPGISGLGLLRFLYYVVIGLFVHHLMYFAAEAANIYLAWYVTKRVFINLIVSSALVIMVELLTMRIPGSKRL